MKDLSYKIGKFVYTGAGGKSRPTKSVSPRAGRIVHRAEVSLVNEERFKRNVKDVGMAQR